jgi:hypothetical protein
MSQPDCAFTMCRMNGRYVFLFLKYGSNYQVQLKVLNAVKNQGYRIIQTFNVPESQLQIFINTTVAGYTQ